MRPNESTPADFATAQDDSQQEDTSHPADKYDAKVMAQKIYNTFGFNGRWTPTDHQLFLTIGKRIRPRKGPSKENRDGRQSTAPAS